MDWEKASRYVRSHRRYLLAGALLAPLIVILIALLFPQALDGALYRYFLGPIVSDAEGRTVDGVREGYNAVNTLVYAGLLGLGLAALLLLLPRWGYRMDARLLLASLPFFLLGGTVRALEDTVLFNGALRYLFITPLVYYLVAGLFVLALYAGRRARAEPNDQAVLVALAAVVAAYYLVTLLWPDMLNYILSPLQPVVLAALSLVLYRVLARRGAGEDLAAVAAVGFFLVVLSLAYLVQFPSSAGWQAAYGSVSGEPPRPAYLELLVIPALAAFLTAGVAVLARLPRLALLAAPANLLMYFAHFLDGAATYRGLELYGYAEKHALPGLLVEATSPLVMLPLKFAVVTAVVLILDRLLKDELSPRPQLAMGLKFAVVLLGLGPGTRDLVRIVLGV